MVVLCGSALSYVVLSCLMLCCVTLCCVVLCSIVLRCVELLCYVLYRVVFCSVVLRSLRCVALLHYVIYGVALRYVTLRYITFDAPTRPHTHPLAHPFIHNTSSFIFKQSALLFLSITVNILLLIISSDFLELKYVCNSLKTEKTGRKVLNSLCKQAKITF